MSGNLWEFLFNLNTECMHFLEKDLENIIWESDNEKLRERGFFINGKKLKQLRIGNYGIADLVTYKKYNDNIGDKYLEITVFELKKEKAGISAFLQAIRYCKGISSYLDDYRPNILYKFNIVLCAKEIDTNSDYIFLTDLISSSEFNVINNITNYSFSYNLDGIKFKEERSYDINKGF